MQTITCTAEELVTILMAVNARVLDCEIRAERKGDLGGTYWADELDQAISARLAIKAAIK